MCFIVGMLDEARKTKESKKSKEFAGIDFLSEQPATTGYCPQFRAITLYNERVAHYNMQRGLFEEFLVPRYCGQPL